MLFCTFGVLTTWPSTFLFCLILLLISYFFFYQQLIYFAHCLSLSFSSSLSFFPINLLVFCLTPSYSVLQPGLVVLSACSFHWQLSWCGCFVFSGRGQCVYLVQILDLFITTADLGSVQAHSPQHQAAMSADRAVEAPALYWFWAGSGLDSLACYCNPYSLSSPL